MVISSNTNLLIDLYNKQATPDNNARVVRSPRLAAMGVATLSGFILHRLDNKTTPTIIAPVNITQN
jgi:hypothetical protein